VILSTPKTSPRNFARGKVILVFELLTEKLSSTIAKLGNRGRLSEKDLETTLKEVRLALLEADVNFRVAKSFIATVKEEAIGAKALAGVDAGHQIIKIVNDQLTSLLSAGDHAIRHSGTSPTTILLVGLQGAGKTTTAAKLALHLRRTFDAPPLLVAADLRRAAAVEQLTSLARQLDIPIHSESSSSAVEVATNGIEKARKLGSPWAIIDTAGRLHIDDELMEELDQIKKAVNPHETLLVVDGMTGQDAVNAAEGFHKQIGLTGLILTKLDGDARGGAALSVTSVTGVPIKLMGTGERPDALEPFHPERMASRVLGMGDVVTLVERAQNVVDEKQAIELEKKLRKASFDFHDFLEQLRTVQRMGPLSQVLEMLPGFSKLKGQINSEDLEGKRLQKVEALILSMTNEERHNPDLLNASRRRRIAMGSGSTVQELNQLLNQFQQMRKLMKQVSRSKGRGLANLMKF
jgi:signal recognition particle subunit SRP54